MKDNVFTNAAGAGDRVVRSFAASKAAVSEALEDGRESVERLLKRTRNSMDDLLEDASHGIKRFPLRSVAVAFGVGAVVGLVVGRSARK